MVQGLASSSLHSWMTSTLPPRHGAWRVETRNRNHHSRGEDQNLEQSKFATWNVRGNGTPLPPGRRAPSPWGLLPGGLPSGCVKGGPQFQKKKQNNFALFFLCCTTSCPTQQQWEPPRLTLPGQRNATHIPPQGRSVSHRNPNNQATPTLLKPPPMLQRTPISSPTGDTTPVRPVGAKIVRHCDCALPPFVS